MYIQQTNNVIVVVYIIMVSLNRCGDITRLLVHGIVNLTNERLDAKLPETEMIYQKGGPDLVAEIRNNVRSRLSVVCHLTFV